MCIEHYNMSPWCFHSWTDSQGPSGRPFDNITIRLGLMSCPLYGMPKGFRGPGNAKFRLWSCHV